MQKLLEVLTKKIPSSTPPIWIMRQAGRYLPEYRELKTHAKDFLDFCYTPKLASEATLQPIKRFDFDAAIIFSDILVIPDALGCDVKFIEKRGPILAPVTSLKNLKEPAQAAAALTPVYEAISLTREKLARDKTLIGFAGAPWTLACYMIEGGSSKNFDKVRTVALTEPKFFAELIDILTESVIIYLQNQIKAGADVIKIFDSHAGVLPVADFQKWVIAPTKKIVSTLRKSSPKTPLICFPKGAGVMYEEFVAAVKPNAIAIDQSVPRIWAVENLWKKHGVILQGNLDNYTLAFGSTEQIKNQTQSILTDFKNQPFIFNLGHGILKETPITNVELMARTVRS